jgi:hypothetical protein
MRFKFFPKRRSLHPLRVRSGQSGLRFGCPLYPKSGHIESKKQQKISSAKEA